MNNTPQNEQDATRNTTLLAPNARRKSATIFNDSTATLYVASASGDTQTIPPGNSTQIEIRDLVLAVIPDPPTQTEEEQAL